MHLWFFNVSGVSIFANFTLLQGAGHNDVELYNQYLERLKTFVSTELTNWPSPPRAPLSPAVSTATKPPSVASQPSQDSSATGASLEQQSGAAETEKLLWKFREQLMLSLDLAPIDTVQINFHLATSSVKATKHSLQIKYKSHQKATGEDKTPKFPDCWAPDLLVSYKQTISSSVNSVTVVPPCTKVNLPQSCPNITVVLV